MKIIAIIPARGGSKGIPRKNICSLSGKPLLAYSIEAALGSLRVNRVVVSTEDEEIAGVALEYGAEVIKRPLHLSGDEEMSESALSHALDELKKNEQYEPDIVVFLQATSPIRWRDDIDKAIETLLVEDADSLFSACVFEGFVWEKKEHELVPLTYDYRNRKIRQQRNEHLKENGSIYVFRPFILRQYGNRLGGKIAVYVMDELDSFQIDTPEDRDLVEFLLEKRSR